MRELGSKAERTGYDGVFKALGDEHRLQILSLLAKQEMSAGEILASMDVVQSTLSHHMKVLTDSGAVNAEKSGRWTIYSINMDALKRAEAYLADFVSGAENAASSEIAEKALEGKAAEKTSEGETAEKAPERKTAEKPEDRASLKEDVQKTVDAAESSRRQREEEREETFSIKEEGKSKKKGKKSKKSKKNGKK